ncbi:MAG: 4Fe-4S dicluster domain-containing protein [Breznakibacter sp.]|nr:4Fe-4S dicluster domain-containing protein [Breznakibacter sp.]
MSATHETDIPLTFNGEVLRDTGVLVYKCYQCGKCSAGCPMAVEMEYPPSLALRMLQTEDATHRNKLLSSLTIWLCVNCEMCLTRCPMEIDIPHLMDYLRQKSMAQKMTNPKAKNIISFHKAFLDSIEHTGRLYELGLIANYKLRSGSFMQDVGVAPKMFAKGKLSLIPEFIKGRKGMLQMFKSTNNGGAQL